jgi:hypothetical protein
VELNVTEILKTFICVGSVKIFNAIKRDEVTGEWKKTT